MRNNYLGFIGFLSLTALLASGCTTQGMAKMDDGSAATMAAATPSEAPATDTASAAADASAAAPAETAAVEATSPADSGTAADTTAAAATTAAPAAAPSDVQIAAKLLPLPPEDVINTIQKLTKHPRVLYMSSKAQYNYYVGGLFNAEYNPGKQIFTISNDARQDSTLSCQYGKDGTMIDQAKLDANTVGQCGQLVNTLSTYLSN